MIVCRTFSLGMWLGTPRVDIFHRCRIMLRGFIVWDIKCRNRHDPLQLRQYNRDKLSTFLLVSNSCY